jgi:PAS domain S-box-containing protein
MSSSLPVFERAIELAKALLAAKGAFIALENDGRLWLSSGPDTSVSSLNALYVAAAQTERCLWIEDARQDPAWTDAPMVADPPYFRSFVGAPIRMSCGTTLGLLCVIGRNPRPYDAAMEANMRRLADFVGDECERARNEEALRSTREALGAYARSVPIAMMMTDLDLRIVQASPKWLKDTGLTLEEVLGRCVYDIDPTYFPYFRKAYEHCLKGNHVTSPRWLSRRKGARRWMRSELTPWRSADGAVGGLISTSVDITDMVDAIDRIERSEQRLKMAVDISQVYVWEMDYERGELVKSGGEDQFFDRDWTYEDLVEDTNVTIDPRDRPRIAEEWKRAAEEDRLYQPQYRIARSDGKEVWVTCTVRLVRDEAGEPIRMVGAMRNITEQKQAEAALLRAKEEAEAANRAKSAFLATMSHEIRTPLNGVLGMAQAIAFDTLTPLQRERLDVLRESGETLLAILNDVLDLSKIEAGKLELEVAEFDLAAVARGAYAAFTAQANRKALGFSLAIEPRALGRYRGDSTRVRQILYNLVSNAVKFTEQGSVVVGVDRVDDELVLSVADTGIGVAPAQLGRLFGKFEQADASTTRRFGGTGLGLAICRELAQLMGGRINASSAPGQGSTFTVSLPLPYAGGAADTPAAAVADRAPEASRALRVLCAEDNSVNQLVLKTLLHQVGVEPVIVADGLQLIEAWRREAWDILLVDVQMPVLDGPGAVQRIRAEEAISGARRTPIIALTANAMAHQAAEYLAGGMDAVVGKPIEIGQLFETIEQLLADADESFVEAAAAS